MMRDSDWAAWMSWALPLLWQRRFSILKVGLAGLAASIVIAVCFPARFKSTVRLMPPDPQSRSALAMMATVLGGPAVPATGTGGLAALVNSRSPNGTFLAILGSRSAQDDLINRFDLRKEYACSRYGAARQKLASRTEIDEDKKTGVVTVTVSDSNPERARAIAAGYIDELNKMVVSMDTSSAHRERVFLEQRLEAVKQDLDDASQRLGRFSSRNATMDVEHQASVTLDATARLQGELIAAQSQLSALQANYTADNPQVRAAEARVETLNRQLEKMDGAGPHASTDVGDGQFIPSLRQLPLLGATYADLYRKVTIEEAVYEALTKEYEMAKVEEAKEIPAVTVLDPPDYPERRSWLPQALMIFFGTILALAGACAWMLGSERWRQMDSSNPHKAAVLVMLARLRQSPVRASQGGSAA